jgi:hypothetical protein
MKNSASMFRAPDAPSQPERQNNCVDVSRPDVSDTLCDPQITLDAKTQVQHIVSDRAFSRIHTESARSLKIVRQHFTP